MTPLRSLLLVTSLVVFPSIAFAEGGVLFMSPERGTYAIRDTFDVRLMADTDGDAISAVEAGLAFDPEGLAVEHISVDDSILSLWVTPPEFNNDKGTITFSGVTDVDFTGPEGLLITITFRALQAVGNDMHYVSGSMLASDGRGSNIITAMRSGLYTIEPRSILPSLDSDGSLPEVLGASIRAPEFRTYEPEVRIGERIILEGIAPPDTLVMVLLQRGEETPVLREIRSTTEGKFTYVSPDRAKRGVYRVWAEIRDENDVAYATSDTILISGKSAGLVAAAASIASVVGAAAPLLGILILAGIALGFFFRRRPRVQLPTDTIQR